MKNPRKTKFDFVDNHGMAAIDLAKPKSGDLFYILSH